MVTVKVSLVVEVVGLPTPIVVTVVVERVVVVAVNGGSQLLPPRHPLPRQIRRPLIGRAHPVLQGAPTL